MGHDLTNENFVKKWFKDTKADYLINCFALNDHVVKKEKGRHCLILIQRKYITICK